MFQANKAYTIIELSIVLVVMGILLIGVTSGSAIVNLAEITYVRSFSSNAPFLKNNNLTIWFDAAQENAFSVISGSKYNAIASPSDQTIINRWNDTKTSQQNNKVNVSQSNSTNSPIYLRKAINGLPGIYFDNNDKLSISNVSPLQLFSDGKASIFIVQTDRISNARKYISWNNGDAQEISILNTTNGQTVFRFGGEAATTSAPVTPVGNSRIISYIKNLNSIDIRVNGRGFALNAPNNFPGRLSNSTPAEFSVGDSVLGSISEIIIFRDALSSQDISDIEKYLSEKWRIAVVKTE